MARKGNGGRGLAMQARTASQRPAMTPLHGPLPGSPEDVAGAGA